MALTSLTFFAFAAAVALVFFLTPGRFRWVVVLIASYGFYATWEAWPAVVGLALLTLVTYACGVGMARVPRYKKLVCAAGLFASLGSLVALKYLDFFVVQAYRLGAWLGLDVSAAAAPNMPWYLPVGFSFVTFTVASYLVDVYRGTIEPEPHLGRLAGFVAFFPKILAGPIERAEHFLPQWRAQRSFDAARATEGLYLITLGLLKKVVLADRLAVFADAAFSAPAYATPVQLVVGIYFYAFQIYCDFSGYTDIAIGVFKVLGFDLATNFRRPYLSRSVPEFWSARWHVTLGTWFRDYLYIPLGGSRVGRWRLYLNLMIVFLVSGIWHAGFVGEAVGWTFIVWGAVNGLYQIASVTLKPLAERWTERAPWLDTSRVVSAIQVFLTFHLITFTWVFFRADTLGDARTVLTRVAGNLGELPTLVRFYDYRAFDFVASLILILVLLVFEVVGERRGMWARLKEGPFGVRVAAFALALAVLVVLGEWGSSAFIYMQF